MSLTSNFNLTETVNGPDPIQQALEAVRTHLGMEVAYLSEFEGETTTFRRVDAPGLEALIKPGDTHRLEDVYCKHVLEGRLPQLIPDTGDLAFAQSLPITRAVPIGAHATIPIHRADGSIFGTLCCLSPRPNRTLNDRDMQVMQMFADLAAQQIQRDETLGTSAREITARIESVIAERNFSFVFQPIVMLESGLPVGFESLCRFAPAPYRTPDVWFAEAASIGRGIALECEALAAALEVLPALPHGLYLSINASPETIIEGDLAQRLAGLPLDRIRLEVTEHAKVADYCALNDALKPLRAQGLKLAVDDAGAGFASLHHIIQLAPEIIKLDMSLTRQIDTVRSKRAMAAALTYFAKETGATIVAEGIEYPNEVAALKKLGVDFGQGYHFAKPAPIDDALRGFALAS